MANLTETAYLSRKAINIGVILLVIVIILRVAFNFFAPIWQRFFPPAPPPATLAFGKLPYPSAQTDIATPSAVTYTLETIDSSLPALPPIFKVYFMPPPTPAFGSFDRMKGRAQALDFTGVPQKITSTAWHFVDTSNFLRTLDIDEVSTQWHLLYDYQKDPSLFSQKSFTSVDQAIADARSVFASAGTLPSDIGKEKASTFLYKFDSGTLVPITSLSETDAIGVTLNRNAIDSVPVLSPNLSQGLVSVLLSSSADPKKKVLEARYFYSPISLENWATYPLIKAADAWEKLKSGQAIFASISLGSPNQIAIRKIYLAYLDPYPPQNFLQPVVVFSDEKGFVAYVPAVSPLWLTSP